jgi:hypothetical protein
MEEYSACNNNEAVISKAGDQWLPVVSLYGEIMSEERKGLGVSCNSYSVSVT